MIPLALRMESLTEMVYGHLFPLQLCMQKGSYMGRNGLVWETVE